MEERSRREQVEDAVLGNQAIGLPGLVINVKEHEVALVHEREERLAGDKRLHERVDTQEKADVTTNRRIDRMIYIAIGAGFGGAFGGGGLVALLSGAF